MDRITGPVTREKVEALTAHWADDASTTIELVHREFNGDRVSGGYAFICDRGLLIHGFDGASVRCLLPDDDASRLAEVEEFWRESQHRNRTLELTDVSPIHRAAIAALVAGMASVVDVAFEVRPGVADTERADALLIMLRRRGVEPAEAAALRALADDDWLLEEAPGDIRAHRCPVCASPAVGRHWHFVGVCDGCYHNVVCRDGRHVTGYNTGPSGGFRAEHIDDQSNCEEVSRTGQVWVDGHECRMGEARFGGVFVGVAPAREFRDDDTGYLAWLNAHSDGYVINIARSHSATQARVHRASCRTVNGQNPRGGGWTGPYVKVCAEHPARLEQWALEHVGVPIPPCGICYSARNRVRPTSTVATEPAAAARLTEARREIHGPAAHTPVVEAWADGYIRFGNLPAWQQHLRHEIRRRCAYLEPSAGQVLHATFFGDKHLNADVENLVLYNIGPSFKTSGRNGIRFEHGAGVPPAPDGTHYPFCYRYALESDTATFASWHPGRTLASFDWTDLGAFDGYKKVAQTWLALSRGHAEVFEPAAPKTPFAARIQVRPPLGHQPVWGGLVKGLLDGVICAFQAHADTTVLPEVALRLANYLPADPAEIAAHLLDQTRAVRGVVPRLVSPYREDVKWDPADHLCVAGELLAAEPGGTSWAIKGELIEVSR